MATITINGASYTGKSLDLVGGRIVVDGVQQGAGLTGIVEIRITEGILRDLRCDASVRCGDVQGSIVAGGSIQCGDVMVSVSAGGSVQCGDVGGRVTAGGSVHHG